MAAEWQFDHCPCGRLAYGSLPSGHRWMFTRVRERDGLRESRVVLIHFAWDGSPRTACSEDMIREAVDDAVSDEVLGS